MSRRSLSPLYRFLIAQIFWWALFGSNAAQAGNVAVIYPELQEPYRGVVESIIEGIQEQLKEPATLFAVGSSLDQKQLKNSIDHEHARAIIALGKTGLSAARQWRGKIPIVVGAMLMAPDQGGHDISGISLAADPEIFFKYLDQLAPNIKRVHVVYSSDSSEWLIQIAKGSAKKRNIQLLAYQSKDIKNSALIYRDIIIKSRPGEDAIWLLPDPVVADDRLILPLLLRGAWDQGILVFTSNPAQVKRGALFALFPDNKVMGASLAKMAESQINGGKTDVQNIIVPLRDLQAAINVRTAEHVGLFISEEQRQKFALIFPSP